MAVRYYANLVAAYDLKSSGSQAIDVVNDIPVRIFNNQGTPVVYVFAGGKEQAAAAVGNLISVAQSMGLAKPRAAGDSIMFGFKKPFNAVEEYPAIKQIIANNSGLFNIDQCPYCGMSGCDTVGMYKSNNARKMHRHCYNSFRNAEIEKVENAQGNYLTGILAAFAVALLIVAVCIVFVTATKHVWPIVFVMIPYLIAFVYKGAKGPYGTSGVLITTGAGIFAMLAYFYMIGCWYASLFYDISMFGAIPYFGDVLGYFSESFFWEDNAMSVVFWVIGVLAAAFASPVSKKAGKQAIESDDLFIIPIASAAFPGFENQDPYIDAYKTTTTTEDYQNAYDQNQNGF